MTTEIWKPIEGYEGRYEVSNMGNVRAMEKRRVVKNRYGGENVRTDKSRQIHQVDNGNGYLYVSLYAEGKKRNHYVHRMVAEAFCDKRSGCDVVNHKDCNKKNNAAENLEWCSQRENVMYSAESMRKPKRKSKTTNTGEKYIRIYRQAGRKEAYRVMIRQKRVCKQFNTLEEAIAYRNEVVSGEL